MATLKLGEPLATREPVVELDPALPVGSYRVQLVVEGSSGRSLPAELRLRVVRALDPRPTPIGPSPIGPVGPVRDPVTPTPFRPT